MKIFPRRCASDCTPSFCPLDFLRIMCIINLSGTLVPDRRKVQYEKQERGADAPHPGVHRKLLRAVFFYPHRSGDCRSHEDRGFLRAQIVSTQDQAKTAHQIAMQRICTAARKDVVVLAYRVATPRQRFRCKKAFSTK